MQKSLDGFNLKTVSEQCLILIPQIVELLRMQSFFMASNKIKSLISNLNTIVSMWIDEEFLLILRCIMSAQEEQDYVLLADVLEGDLLPLLQRVQLEQLNQTEIEQSFFWNENLEMLGKENPNLAEELKRLDTQNTAYFVIPAINGQPTLKYGRNDGEYCLHSTVNPHREAEFFARKYVQSDCRDYYIYGMGLGHHVLAILQESKRNRVIVLERELEVIRLALQYQDFSTYLEDGRMQIVWNRSVSSLLQRVKEKKDALLLVHYPSLQLVPEGEEKAVLENYFMSMNSMLEQRKLLDENFKILQKMNLPECSGWKKHFEGKDIVIVAGGPSVDIELQALKEHQDEFAILTVGTTAGKLLEYGILPDAIVISDAQEHMYRQIEQLEIIDIPLFLLSTASADVAEHYAGDVYLVYQEGYVPAEQTAKACGYTLFQTGSSVTTLALDIAIQFQAKRIILVGTDMAYTNHQSHAGGLGRTIGEDVKLRQVESVDGTMVETANNLDIYRRWIERHIRTTAIPIYNTARGARIQGTIEKSIQDILQV